MDKKYWVKEKMSVIGNKPRVCCPLKIDDAGKIIGVMLEMAFVGNPEPVVGEFWFDENNKLYLELQRGLEKKLTKT